MGLGLMGAPMAARLIEAGHELQVTSRRRESAVELESRGAVWRRDAGSCAVGTDATVLMLPDAHSVERAALGPDGALAGRPGVLIDMSTTDPRLAEDFAHLAGATGLSALDAPVSGGPVAAAAGTLSIMVGGERETYTAMRPLFDALGTSRLLGPAGSGQRTKLVNQVLVAASSSGIVEAWALASRLGLDGQVVQEVLAEGVAGSSLLGLLWPRLQAKDMSPGFKIDQMVKDLRLALAEAEVDGARDGDGDDGGAGRGGIVCNLELHTAAVTLQRYVELAESGEGALGTQALVRHRSLSRPTDRSS